MTQNAICYIGLGGSKSSRIIKSALSDFANLGGFCLLIELHQGGSATNGATPFSFLCSKVVIASKLAGSSL